jgi:hypothetical protein
MPILLPQQVRGTIPLQQLLPIPRTGTLKPELDLLDAQCTPHLAHSSLQDCVHIHGRTQAGGDLTDKPVLRGTSLCILVEAGAIQGYTELVDQFLE